MNKTNQFLQGFLLLVLALLVTPPVSAGGPATNNGNTPGMQSAIDLQNKWAAEKAAKDLQDGTLPYTPNPVDWQIDETNPLTGEVSTTKVAAGQVALELKTPGIVCSIDDEQVDNTIKPGRGRKHTRAMYCQQKGSAPLPGLPASSNHTKPFQKVVASCRDWDPTGTDYGEVEWSAKTQDNKPLVKLLLSCFAKKAGG